MKIQRKTMIIFSLFILVLATISIYFLINMHTTDLMILENYIMIPEKNENKDSQSFHYEKMQNDSLIFYHEYKDYVDKTVALDIAKAVMRNIYQKEMLYKMKYSISYAEQEKIYIVVLETKEESVTIRINQNDGAIIDVNGEKLHGINEEFAKDLAVIAWKDALSSAKHQYLVSYREKDDLYFVTFSKVSNHYYLGSDYTIAIRGANGEVFGSISS